MCPQQEKRRSNLSLITRVNLILTNFGLFMGLPCECCELALLLPSGIWSVMSNKQQIFSCGMATAEVWSCCRCRKGNSRQDTICVNTTTKMKEVGATISLQKLGAGIKFKADGNVCRHVRCFGCAATWRPK